MRTDTHIGSDSAGRPTRLRVSIWLDRDHGEPSDVCDPGASAVSRNFLVPVRPAPSGYTMSAIAPDEAMRLTAADAELAEAAKEAP